MIPSFKTLYAQLLFWGVLVCGSLGVGVYAYELQAVRSINADYSQRVYWKRPALFAEKLAPALGDRFSETKLQMMLDGLQAEQPFCDFYILDGNGAVRLHSSDPIAPSASEAPRPVAIDLEPIQAFLKSEEPIKGGIFGTDPQSSNRSPFVAAPISLDSGRGYLYVVLNVSVRGYPRDYRPWYYPWIVVIVGIVFSMLVCYILLFAKPVRAILQGLESIAAGALSARVPVYGQDELGRISQGINDMADTIESTIAELHKADRLQREMAAALSHDFGTPLFSAQAYLHKLRDEHDCLSTEEKRGCLDIAARNLEKLRELVSSFFELSKLDSRELTPCLEPFYPLDLVTEEIIPKLAPLAASKKVALRAKFDDMLPRVVGDVSLIDRALTNLIINGINYNRPGGEVLVVLRSRHDRVEFEVSDDGIGIKGEDLPYIFDRFFRSDPSRAGSTGGSGLGLAVVKKILEAHNETISVESQQDAGTKFMFSLKAFVGSAV